MAAKGTVRCPLSPLRARLLHRPTQLGLDDAAPLHRSLPPRLRNRLWQLLIDMILTTLSCSTERPERLFTSGLTSWTIGCGKLTRRRNIKLPVGKESVQHKG